jgi:Phage integrase, N-terminal SAM-like domain
MSANRERIERGVYRRHLVNGTPRFEIGFRDSDHRWRFQAVDGGLREARAAHADVIARRDHKHERVAPQPRLTFATASKGWWEADVVGKRPNTQSTYRAALQHLERHFGRMKLSDIRPKDVAEYLAKSQRGGRKGWSLRGDVTVLNSVYGYAAQNGFAGANPVKALKRGQRPSVKDAKERRVLTPDELDRLLAAVEPRWRLVFEVAAQTGARQGRIEAMYERASGRASDRSQKNAADGGQVRVLEPNRNRM